MSDLLKLKWSLPPKDEDYEESEDFMWLRHTKNNELNQDGIPPKKAKLDFNSLTDTVILSESKNFNERQNSEMKNSRTDSFVCFNDFKYSDKIKTESSKYANSGFDLFESSRLRFSDLKTESSIIPPSYETDKLKFPVFRTESSIIPPSLKCDKPKYEKIEANFKSLNLTSEYTQRDVFEDEEMPITSSFAARQIQECEEFEQALAISQEKPSPLSLETKKPALTKKKKINTDIKYFKRDYSLFETIKNIKMVRVKQPNEFLNAEQQEKYPITLKDFIW